MSNFPRAVGIFSTLLSSSPPASVPMAGLNDSKTHRVKEVTELIRSQNWSFNDFLIAFYSSDDTSIASQRGRCLTKVDGARFTPEELLDLWLANCPSGSQSYLEHVIVDRASRIIIKETNRACALKSLSVSTTSVKADDVDEHFLLSKLETVYTATLPCLWFLLNAIITSPNRSEQQKQEAAASKETRARFVESSLSFDLAFWLIRLEQACVVIVSILLFCKNRATNAFQIIMGLFLGISGATKRVLSVCNHMGVSVSYE